MLNSWSIVSASDNRLPDEADDLLSKVAELREMERRSHEVPMSSPAFHDLARRIAAQSREIFMHGTNREKPNVDAADDSADGDDR